MLFVVIATMTIINGGIAHAKSSSPLFSSARKEYVNSKSALRKVSPQEVSIAMGIAEERTKSLEQQIKIYLNVHEMGFGIVGLKALISMKCVKIMLDMC